MTSEEWKKIADLYFKIIDLPHAEQSTFIAKAKKQHPNIIAEVLAMLAEDQSLHPALQTGNRLEDFFQTDDQDLIGSRLGNYELVEYLGGGGMGSVFLAEQVDGELERKVALKLIRRANTKPIALERFKQERQILANLKHPNIAHLYEGGTTEEGRLYFTMEYVEGLTLDIYCQQNRLSLKEKLNLFKQILSAIAYAHQQLVLHLDIKPGNILIEKDGKVKIVDFGVSKLVHSAKEDALSKTPYTLAFAAPEQIQNQATSTATDIYALGGLLYKLLTGHLPFDRTNTSIATLTAQFDQEQLSLDNFGTVEKNNKYPIDLFHICRKALQFKPLDRYSSVEQFHADLQAIQQQYPISLRKDESLYVGKRFLQRNIQPIAYASLFFLALAGTVLFYTTQLQKEKNIAQKEATKNKQLVDLMTDMFKSADPYVSQNDTLPIKHFLQQTNDNLEKNLDKEPELFSEMSLLLSSVYNSLGNYELADSLADQSLTVYASSALIDQAGFAKAIKNKADVAYSLGNYVQADSLYQLALHTFQELDNPKEEDLGQCYLSLGQVHIELGRYAVTDSFLILAQNNFEKVLTPPHVDLAITLHGRGDAARKLRKFDQSATFYQAALAMQKQLFQVPNTEIAYTLNHLASLQYDQFKYAKGIPFAEESYRQRKAIFGDQHVETIASKSNLSRLLANTGDYETAMQHKLEIYDHLLAIFGSHLHPYVIGTQQGIASMYASMGNWEKSAAAYKKIIDQLPELPFPYPVAYVPFQGYGNALHQLGKSQQAEQMLRKALEVLPTSTRVLPTGPISVRYDLAVCLFDTNQKEEAKVLMMNAQTLLKDYPDFPIKRIARMEEILQ